ncbi:MAG: glycogen/starch/alpha-glucan phosphorylase [Sulfolobales archaeon]
MIVSITPEIGIDEIPIYAGGLGILEGDKFLEAARRDLNYTVLTLFYRRGYVYYDVVDGEIKEIEKDFSNYRSLLREEEPLEVSYDGEKILIKPLVYTLNKARIVYFDISGPEKFSRKLDRLYIEDETYSFEAKYSILAKASYEYMDKRIGFKNISIIDIQESLASLISLLLPHSIRKRLIIHTPGPWGHPKFSRETLSREFGYIDGEQILTKISASRVDEVYTVSEKHYEITLSTFPEFSGKLSYVTNGINIERWVHREIKKFYKLDKIDPRDFHEAHMKAKIELVDLLKNYKKIDVDSDKMIISWARRVTRYKRPYFMIRLAEDLADRDDVLIVLGGKAHPKDLEGLGYMRIFRELHEEYKNVVYIHDYDVEKAKLILSGSDLLLFTPFPGWEASGTSFMKAGANGVPSLASRDGAALEMIRDGFNGWFFGSDIRYPIDLYSTSASEIDQRDYKDFHEKLTMILDLYHEDYDSYVEIMINSMKTYGIEADIWRVLKTLYSDIMNR